MEKQSGHGPPLYKKKLFEAEAPNTTKGADSLSPATLPLGHTAAEPALGETQVGARKRNAYVSPLWPLTGCLPRGSTSPAPPVAVSAALGAARPCPGAARAGAGRAPCRPPRA